MDRRKFLIAPIALMGLPSVEAKIVDSVKALNDIQLGEDNAYLAQPGATFIMPGNPKHGDKIRIVVDQKSLSNPCQIKDSKHKIAGANEPLILDSLAIFSMTFDSENKNWMLT